MNGTVARSGASSAWEQGNSSRSDTGHLDGRGRATLGRPGRAVWHGTAAAPGTAGSRTAQERTPARERFPSSYLRSSVRRTPSSRPWGGGRRCAPARAPTDELPGGKSMHRSLWLRRVAAATALALVAAACGGDDEPETTETETEEPAETTAPRKSRRTTARTDGEGPRDRPARARRRPRHRLHPPRVGPARLPRRAADRRPSRWPSRTSTPLAASSGRRDPHHR